MWGNDEPPHIPSIGPDFVLTSLVWGDVLGKCVDVESASMGGFHVPKASVQSRSVFFSCLSLSLFNGSIAAIVIHGMLITSRLMRYLLIQREC